MIAHIDQVSPAPVAPDIPRSNVVRRIPGAFDRDPARFRRRRRRVELSLAIFVPVALVCLWQLASEAGWIDARFFPAPTRIWSTAVELVRDGDLQRHLTASIRRVLLGYAIGSLIGVVAGVGLGMFRTLRAGFEPLLYALWTVPKLALLPLLLLIFGLGETPIIVMIVINCFFLVAIPTTAAIASVPFAYREASASFDASRAQLLRHVLLPCALPQIFTALKLAAGASILVLVAAEFVQGNVGIGYLIWNSWSLFLADRMYVGIVVVAIVGSLFTLLIGAVGHRLTPWDRDD